MNGNPLPNSVEDNVIHVNLFHMLKHKLYIFIGRTIRVGFGCMISKEFLGINLGLLPEDVENFLLDKRLFSLFILLGTFLMKCFIKVCLDMIPATEHWKIWIQFLPSIEDSFITINYKRNRIHLKLWTRFRHIKDILCVGLGISLFMKEESKMDGRC